jgi:hypothetical protein
MTMPFSTFSSKSLFETLFPVLFIVVFCLIVGIIIFVIVKGIGQWNRNNHSPRITVPARVASRRESVTAGHGHSMASTQYYATFELESGDRIELQLSGHEFGFIAEGDFGQLTFQGTRFISYVRY